MQFLFTSTDCRAAELAARRRLGVADERDAERLALAGSVGASGGGLAERTANAARAAARGLERLARRLEPHAVGAPRSTPPLARR